MGAELAHQGMLPLLYVVQYLLFTRHILLVTLSTFSYPNQTTAARTGAETATFPPPDPLSKLIPQTQEQTQQRQHPPRSLHVLPFMQTTHSSILPTSRHLRPCKIIPTQAPCYSTRHSYTISLSMQKVD